MRSLGVVMFVIAVAFGVVSASARADTSPEAQAKALFDQGLVASDEERWADAAALFEHSRGLLERPSTVFNLLGALYRLGRYDESLRLVQRYLEISDPVADATRRHETDELRASIERARAKTTSPVASSVAPASELPPVRELEPAPVMLETTSGVSPYAPVMPDRAPSPNRRRKRAIWITSSLLVVGAVTASLLLTMRDDGPRGPACGADTTAGRCIEF